ncbi:MAG: type I-C CRISPR-associated protein Cas8c/Csd1 [Clostridia bacterium]|nr:type I-C CRISPR-associated protein Cas8c/Csd1 [Clostridia bacterium]
MGLLQKAYETYENHRSYVGVSTQEAQEPLAPVAHIITAAQIEITINQDGQFISAAAVGKNEPKIIIPATEKSAGRAGTTIAPHPLCDQLGYISVINKDKLDAYVEQLTDWAESAYSHPMLAPILSYVKGKTLLDDLARAGIDKPGEKDMVRWIVVGLDANGGACWNNQSLFDSFINYYTAKKSADEQVLCMITGSTTPAAKQHLKGIISINGNAKLISANDTVNFTYRGRFKSDDQAVTIGYEASQKAHNALKWLAASQGVIIGGRTFLCWNPKGKRLPRPINPLRPRSETPALKLAQYRKELAQVLWGYKKDFDRADCAVIASFDAATTGRLAVTYYNEILVQDFLDQLEKWDTTCIWKHNRFGIESPSLDRIINCAFGTDRGGRIETDERVMKQQLQRLLACRVDGAGMPYDIVQAIAQKTTHPLAYDATTRDYLQFTACAVIRKYYMDWKQEEYLMALEKDKNDISYQYGRLLAILEKAERDTYDNGEAREPNAIRMQSVFCTRPAQTAKNVIEQLKKSYYPKLTPGLRIFYDRLIGEVYEKISAHPQTEWNASLRETYIMGYYLQKNALYTKNSVDNETEEE